VSNREGLTRSRWYAVWAAATAVLVVGGAVGAVLAASAVARNDAERSQREFERSSAEVASTLELAIHDEESLLVNGSAYVLANPNTPNGEFTRWLGYVHAFERYPELQSVGDVVIVPASELSAFAARAIADPIGPLEPDGSFAVTPAGDRPFYCLSSIGLASDPSTDLPAGFDFCADPAVATAITGARDTGQSSYLPIPIADGVNWLGVQVPVYRGGAVPATVEARRSAFVGLFGVLVDPSLVMDRALQGHPDMSVSLRYRLNSADVEFSSRPVGNDAHATAIDLHNGWTVQAFATVVSEGVFTNGNALALLIAGVVLSLLLGTLMFVLSTGRVRALRLVRERTAQLRGAQAQLVDAARQAGMAEIATNVLHNVGNVLNSVNVSADLVGDKVRRSKSAGLSKAVALMNEHTADLGDFLTTDARGKRLPAYLDTLAATLATERESIDEELRRLTDGVAHIKEIVNAQQSLAGVCIVREQVNVEDLLEDALRMAGLLGQPAITVTRDFGDAGVASLDRHRVLSILLNLMSNADQAMTRNGDGSAELDVRAELIDEQNIRITIGDNGEGIPPENLARIFVHGFSTHVNGHGFGLHSAALSAKEMGGRLSVHSEGVGTGATFTLDLPLVGEPAVVV
jgi:signal transduction histidine kinase